MLEHLMGKGDFDTAVKKAMETAQDVHDEQAEALRRLVEDAKVSRALISLIDNHTLNGGDGRPGASAYYALAESALQGTRGRLQKRFGLNEKLLDQTVWVVSYYMRDHGYEPVGESTRTIDSRHLPPLEVLDAVAEGAARALIKQTGAWAETYRGPE